jgi:LysR family transcriptional regulator, hydrogen peroxide-inducible genes activator
MINFPSMRHLRHLTALEEQRHFGRAANACLVTQSALSASIKELECVLDATLVDRTKRGVVLTPTGVETVERARAILADVEALMRSAVESQEPLSGVLRMGIIPTIAPYLLPNVLPGLHRKFRRLRLHVVEDLTERLINSMQRGSLDVVLLALPYECGDVETAILFEDHLMAGLPRTHPLTRMERLEPESLRNENLLLLKGGCGLRAHALAACGLADQHGAETLEATTLATLLKLVDNELGVTLLPTLAVEAKLLSGTRVVARPLLGHLATRQISLVWRRETGRSAEFRLLASEFSRSRPAANEVIT